MSNDSVDRIHAACLFALASLLAARGADAQTLRSANVDVGLVPSFAAVGHVDGDGVLDFVVAPAGGSELAVMRGLGHGAFAPPQDARVEENLTAIALTDLNEDGLSDLVLCTADGVGATSPMAVHLCLGDGTFGPPSIAVIPTGAADIAAADLDKDGHVDLVVPCFASQKVVVLYGGGDGTFIGSRLVAAEQRPEAVAIGDMNGDTYPDVLVGSAIFDFSVPNPTGVSVLLNDGTGGLALADTAAMPQSVHDVALGDVNGDGRLDALVYHAGTWLMAGLGGGQLASPVQLDVGLAEVQGGLTTADFDEDGDADLALATDGTVRVLESHGDLSFGPPVHYGTTVSSTAPIAADLTGDGDLDLLTIFDYHSPAHWVTIVGGRGDGTFGPNVGTSQDVTAGDVEFGDLDGDGRQDMLAAGSAIVGMNVGMLAVYHGLGPGGFEESQTLATGQQQARSIALADFDEDGALDIAAAATPAGPTPASLVRFLGDGSGGFGPAVTVATPIGPRQLEALDLNHDGHADLAVLCTIPLTLSYGLQVALGNGDGSFQPLISTPVTTQSLKEFTMADFNVDGHVDAALIFGSQAASSVQVFLGTGTGAFGAPFVMPGGGQSTLIAAGDLDGDHVPDLVTTGTGEFLFVHISNGDGTFGPAQPIPLPGVQPRALAVADVDGDGTNDVTCTLSEPDAPGSPSGVGGELVLLPGQGNGTFGAAEHVSAGQASALEIADVDGDGALDAALVGGTVWLLLSELGPWHTIGDPLAGTLGLPKQTGEGSLQPGSKFEIALHDARPLTPAAQVVGLTAINAPFKGGTLVPAANLVLSPLFTDAAGDLALSGNWPLALPSGLQLYLQFWIPDPAGAQGWAASAGLQATLP